MAEFTKVDRINHLLNQIKDAVKTNTSDSGISSDVGDDDDKNKGADEKGGEGASLNHPEADEFYHDAPEPGGDREAGDLGPGLSGLEDASAVIGTKTKEVEDLSRALKIAQDKHAALELKSTQIKAELAAAQLKAKNADTAQGQVAALEMKSTQIEAALAAAQLKAKNADTTQGQVAALEKESAELKAELATIRSELNAEKANSAAAATKQASAEQSVLRTEKDRDQLRANLKTVQDALRRQLDLNGASKNELQNTIKKSESEIAGLKQLIHTLGSAKPNATAAAADPSEGGQRRATPKLPDVVSTANEHTKIKETAFKLARKKGSKRLQNFIRAILIMVVREKKGGGTTSTYTLNQLLQLFAKFLQQQRGNVVQELTAVVGHASADVAKHAAGIAQTHEKIRAGQDDNDTEIKDLADILQTGLDLCPTYVTGTATVEWKWNPDDFVTCMAKCKNGSTRLYTHGSEFSPEIGTSEFAEQFESAYDGNDKVILPMKINKFKVRDKILKAGCTHKEHLSKEGLVRMLLAAASLNIDPDVPGVMVDTLHQPQGFNIRQLLNRGLNYEQIWTVAYFTGMVSAGDLLKDMFAEVGITSPYQIRQTSPTPTDNFWKVLILNCNDAAWINAAVILKVGGALEVACRTSSPKSEFYNAIANTVEDRPAWAEYTALVLGHYADYDLQFAKCCKLWKSTGNELLIEKGLLSTSEKASLTRALAHGLPYDTTYDRVLRERPIDMDSDLPYAVAGHDRTLKLWKIYKDGKTYNILTQLAFLWSSKPFDATELCIIMMCMDLHSGGYSNVHQKDLVPMCIDILNAAKRSKSVHAEWGDTIAKWTGDIVENNALNKPESVTIATGSTIETLLQTALDILTMLGVSDDPASWPSGCSDKFKYLAHCARIREYMTTRMTRVPVEFDGSTYTSPLPLYLYDALTQCCNGDDIIQALPRDIVEAGPPMIQYIYNMTVDVNVKLAVAAARSLENTAFINQAKSSQTKSRVDERKDENFHDKWTGIWNEACTDMNENASEFLQRAGKLVFFGGRKAARNNTVDLQAGDIQLRVQVARKMGYYGHSPNDTQTAEVMYPSHNECRATGLHWLHHVRSPEDVINTMVVMLSSTVDDKEVAPSVKMLFDTFDIGMSVFGPQSTNLLTEFADITHSLFLVFSAKSCLESVDHEVRDATGGLTRTVASAVAALAECINLRSNADANNNVLAFALKIGACRIGNTALKGNFTALLRHSQQLINDGTMTEGASRMAFISAWLGHYQSNAAEPLASRFAARGIGTPSLFPVLELDSAEYIRSANSPTYTANGFVTPKWEACLDVDGFWPSADATVTSAIKVDNKGTVTIQQYYVGVDALATPSTVTFSNQVIPMEGISGKLTGSHAKPQDVRVTVVGPRTLRVTSTGDASHLNTPVLEFMQSEIMPVESTATNVYNFYTKQIGPNTVPTLGPFNQSINIKGVKWTGEDGPDNFVWEIKNLNYYMCNPLYVYWDDDTGNKTPSSLTDSKGVIRWVRIRIATRPWDTTWDESFKYAYSRWGDIDELGNVSADIREIESLMIAGQYNTVKYYEKSDGLPDCPIPVTTLVREFIKKELQLIKDHVADARHTAKIDTPLYIL